ncbi:unnamed protein product, partial [Brachionus calyciflorus]
CKISLEIYAYTGQTLEFRCQTNETSRFTRISHQLDNGTVETLLSNDHFNIQYQRSEIHIVKYNNIYIIRIDPVKYHSAGVYTCEDDVSAQNHQNHVANVTLRVLERKNGIKFGQWKFAKVPYLPASLTSNALKHKFASMENLILALFLLILRQISK